MISLLLQQGTRRTRAVMEDAEQDDQIVSVSHDCTVLIDMSDMSTMSLPAIDRSTKRLN